MERETSNFNGVLHDKAREAIRRGKLPSRHQDRTLGGAGSGAECAVCGDPVMRHMTELEIQFNHGETVSYYHLHYQCFAAWDFERTNIPSASN